MIDQQKTREQAIDEQTRIAPLPATAYWLLAIGHWLFLAPSPLVFPIPRSQATVHDPRSTAPGLSGLCFSRSLAPLLPASPFPRSFVFLTTNHYSLISAFTHPPIPKAPTPPALSRPTPPCRFVKL